MSARTCDEACDEPRTMLEGLAVVGSSVSVCVVVVGAVVVGRRVVGR